MNSPDHVVEADVVSFENPPVSEVVFSVQFAHDLADEATALSDFRPRIREEFPGLERQVAVPPAHEDFQVPPAPQAPQLQFFAQGPPVRYLFVSTDGNRVVQVQPDRFLFNWRKADDHDVYPRYRVLRPAFQAHYKTFLESVDEDKVAAAPPTWCELSYVNTVVAPGPDGRHAPLDEILNVVASPAAGLSLTVEDSAFQQRFIIPGLGDGEGPVGRLYLQVAPGFRMTDGTPSYLITWIARGIPPLPGVPGVLAFFDRGRSLIVSAFRDTTTPAMHARWGLLGET